jgi:type IV secretory pathway VirB10-like protein
MSIEEQQQRAAQPSPELSSPLRSRPARPRGIFATDGLRRGPRWPLWGGIGLAGVIVIAVVAIIIHAGSRRRSMAQGTAMPSGSLLSSPWSGASYSTPKPSPIGRYQPAPPPPPPVQTVQAAPVLPPPQSPLNTDSAVVPPPLTPTPAPAPPPAQNPTASLPFGVKMPAKRDGFNNGCKDGELVLQVSAVIFTCRSDAGKSITLRVEQIRALDNNGVVINAGQKYHFDIDGKQRQDVHQLFAQWLDNARRTSPPANN